MTVIRVRGLPYSATRENIVDFFKGVNISGQKEGIHFVETPGGRPTGEAYVELETDDDGDLALERHRQNMGQRYIEVFRSSETEMKAALSQTNTQTSSAQEHLVLRLRGLPFDLQRREIFQFFAGIELSRNSVCILTDHTGRCSGDAYVYFDSLEMLEKAKAKHMEKIGHRYIEIFKSDREEADRAIRRQEDMNLRRGGGGGGYGGPPPPPLIDGRGGRGGYMRDRPPYPEYGYIPGPYGASPDPYMRGPPPPPRGGPGPMRGGPMREPPYGPRSTPYARPPRGSSAGSGGAGPYGAPAYEQGGGYEKIPSMTGFMVHMRGLPFSATVHDIRGFFRPLSPVDVRLIRLPNGRASGEADVDFASHEDAKEAMKKDRQIMDTRYIELFLDSRPGQPYDDRRAPSAAAAQAQPPAGMAMKPEAPDYAPSMGDPYSKNPYGAVPHDPYGAAAVGTDPYGKNAYAADPYASARDGPYW